MKKVILCIFLFSLSFLFACSGGRKIEVDIQAKMDNQPVAGASIQLDGQELGKTDEKGLFTGIVEKKPGTEVQLAVTKEAQGYIIQPWKNSFIVKLPKDNAVEKYSFEVNFEFSKSVTFAVTEKGTPLKDVIITVNSKKAGDTDEKGEVTYSYNDLKKPEIEVTAAKKGYSTWRRMEKIEPGRTIDISLSKQAVVRIKSVTEEYGRTKGIQGAAVSINSKQTGRTNAEGVYTYIYKGEPGKKVSVSISTPGYIPSGWKGNLVLEGSKEIERYFYPTSPKPIRTGVYRFVSNVPGEDLKDVLERVQMAVADNLFKNPCFREVPAKTLQAEMKRAKVNIDRISAKGWQKTRLGRTVDMIVVGSVGKDDQGFIIEAKFYTAGGKLILSQITRADDADEIGKAAREIVGLIMDRFPFEGTVVSTDGDRFRINLGRSGYKISRGMEFAVMNAETDKNGRAIGYKDIGTLKVRKSEKSGAWAEANDLRNNGKVSVGDKVVRRIYREVKESERKYLSLSVKGGVSPDTVPLEGVNIYLDDNWVGATGPEGRADVPVRLGERYNLLLYRQGYKQANEKVKIRNDKESKEFILAVNNSMLKVDSQPSHSEVSLDGAPVGKTPLLTGMPVSFGFHTVRLSAGGDYRDWEEIIEFDKKEEDLIGDKKIVLFKDYLRLGRNAEEQGSFDAAIQDYSSTGKDHPDYSEAHARLAQILLDEKNDYEGAIREFENVLSLPENKQLVYKQFAVMYTNLGHAYYENGNKLIDSNREASAQNFAKAIKNLQVAKQNMRFFPTKHYDEAVHDTYYYLALSIHKLYLITRKNSLLNSASLAWREYFDFFPASLENNPAFVKIRESAKKYRDQIADIMM